jgi:hypothetical protein
MLIAGWNFKSNAKKEQSFPFAQFQQQWQYQNQNQY